MHPAQGCQNAGAANATIFPAYGCDLKNQPNITTPTQAPLAYSRGPPTTFTSGGCWLSASQPLQNFSTHWMVTCSTLLEATSRVNVVPAGRVAS